MRAWPSCHGLVVVDDLQAFVLGPTLKVVARVASGLFNTLVEQLEGAGFILSEE